MLRKRSNMASRAVKHLLSDIARSESGYHPLGKYLAKAFSTLLVVNHSSPTFLPFESIAGFSCFICCSPGVLAHTFGVNLLPLNQTASCSFAYEISPLELPCEDMTDFTLTIIGKKSSVTWEDWYVYITQAKDEMKGNAKVEVIYHSIMIFHVEDHS